VPWEIQRALVEVFDLPLSAPNLELFGQGVAHAFSAPTLRYTHRVDGVQLPPEWQVYRQEHAGAAQLADDGRALVEAMPSRWVEMKLRH
jgi:hypothetical protein